MGPFIPTGVFDHPSDQPGIDDIELDSSTATRLLRDATRLLKRLDDLRPGLHMLFELPF